jgi:carotenoid cleavage dioxygenase-like enzyme
MPRASTVEFFRRGLGSDRRQAQKPMRPDGVAHPPGLFSTDADSFYATATVAPADSPSSGSYPGEPVFLPEPGGEREDAGVLLAVTLDAVRERSYLLALDAGTLEELARATVPHVIPFGFHGQFASEV